MLRYKKYPNGFSESITEVLTCFRTEKRRFLAWFFASKKSKNTCQKHLLQKHIFYQYFGALHLNVSQLCGVWARNRNYLFKVPTNPIFGVLFLNFVVEVKSKSLAVFGCILHERLQTNFHITHRCCYALAILIAYPNFF